MSKTSRLVGCFCLRACLFVGELLRVELSVEIDIETELTFTPPFPVIATNCATIGPTAAKFYEILPFEGLENNVCGDCAALNNQTFILENVVFSCTWQLLDVQVCGSTLQSWQLIEPALGDVIELKLVGHIGPVDMVVYQIDKADWNSFGPNVFSLVSNTSHCSSWPATLTVQPSKGP